MASRRRRHEPSSRPPTTSDSPPPLPSFGLLLRGSEYKGDAYVDAVAEIAQDSLGTDAQGYRTEFVELIRRARKNLPVAANCIASGT